MLEFYVSNIHFIFYLFYTAKKQFLFPKVDKHSNVKIASVRRMTYVVSENTELDYQKIRLEPSLLTQ